jgi:S-DNA-T family DNA segregation ATPase FtsK/SpoIIIE
VATRAASRSRKPAATKSTARRRVPRAPARPVWRRAVEGHEEDLAGLALIVVAVLVGLGVYADVGGPVGRGINAGLGALIGVARGALPVVLAAVGVALIVDRRSEHRARLAIGSSIGAVAGLGLLHTARGPSAFPGTRVEVERAGGWIGAAVGQPLTAVLATAGAVIVLVAVALAALLVVTHTSLRGLGMAVARRASTSVRPAFGAARRAASDLSTLTSERLGGREPPVDLYDVEADEVYEPERRPPVEPAALAVPAPLAALPSGPSEQLEIALGRASKKAGWRLPPLNLLLRSEAQEIDKKAVEERGRVLEAALASHGVETRLVGMTVGPTVTRYELELGAGVKVARVTSLHKDIAYAMAAIDVRILAPIPGRSAIGVEVPNHARHLVSLGDLLTSLEAKKAVHPLEVAIGKDIAGRAVLMNMATMPHLLIAGATGAGKSSGINCLVTSILMRSTPDQVRLILIDPKRVEMGQYNRLPHLLTQVVTHPKKAANALQWAVKEMERRYDLLHEVGVRDVTGYNAAFDRGELEPQPGIDKVYTRLPFILIVVDELNDLMMVAARDVEDSITRIAQMARAVGIHLVIATQRPSVNVLTGVIKANVPARIAFAVSSLTDSRVILDQPGAERLVGKGDMLLLGPASSVAQRIQGAWVSEEEVRKVVGHWRRQAPDPTYVEGVEGDDNVSGGGLFNGLGGDDDDDETLMRQAIDLVVRSQLGSTSMLQRKLKVGFARAGRLMDLLEQRGVVGPSEGSKARAVLMTVEELDALSNGG